MKKRVTGKFVWIKDNRAISTVVSTLLILLLVFVAVGILWVVISNVIQEGTEQVSLGKFTLSLDIQSVEVSEADSSSLEVRVRRNAGAGEFTGLSFIIDDGDTTEVFEEEVSMKEYAVKTFKVDLQEINPNNVQRVGVAPVFTLDSGKEVTGDIKDEFEVSSSGSSGDTGDTGDGAVCGNGANETGEECDDDNTADNDGCSSGCTIESGWTCSGGSGNSTCEEISTEDCGDEVVQSENNEQCDDGDANNGVECTAAYGSSCTYCSSSCQNVTVQGGSCGDGTLQSSDEECDGSVPSGESCETQVGSGYTGTLSCASDCTIDSSQCTQDSGSGTQSWETGMVSWWNFDDNANDSVGGNHGTVNGAAHLTSGCKSSGCYDFDGVDDYIDVNSFDENFLDSTFVAWVYADFLEGCDGLVFSRQGSTSGLNLGSCSGDGSNLGYHWNDNYYSWGGGPTVPTGEWVLISLVVESSQATLYSVSSGGLSSEINSAPHTSSTIDGLRIGSDILSGRYFEGKIDEVMVWNESLNSSEVSDLYNYFN